MGIDIGVVDTMDRCGSKSQTPENRKPPYILIMDVQMLGPETYEKCVSFGGAMDKVPDFFCWDYSHVVRSNPIRSSRGLFFFVIYTHISKLYSILLY